MSESTIHQAIGTFRKESETIDSSQPINVPEGIGINDMIPQGDIGLMVLEDLPPGAEKIAWPENGQLAPGNTKGGRHCIPQQFHKDLELYRVNDGDQLSDLAIKANTTFDLVHPEHADHIGYPPNIYRVRHQQNAQRMRVLD